VRTRPPRKRVGQATGPRRLAGEILDVATATALLGGTEKQTRARVARGLLPYRRWGSRIVFLRSELLAFIARLDGVSVEAALANVRQRDGEDAG
jgi:hypothetical protein